MPTDPVLVIIGDKGSEALYKATYISLGLDKPLYYQFWIYIKALIHGDWGRSLLTGNPVLLDIQRVFPATLELASCAMFIGVGFGIPLGILAALKKGTLIDGLIQFISLLSNSFSIFWLGLMGLLIFYATLEWLPGPGRVDLSFDYTPITGLILLDSIITMDWPLFSNGLRHLILPASILGFFKIGHISRMTRTFLLEQLNQEYITTAKVKGLRFSSIIFRHALPNIAIPLITVIALSYGTLLEGSTFIEIIFMWPGLGFYLTQALISTDMNAVLGATFLIGVIFIGVNAISDYLYRLLDPRVT